MKGWSRLVATLYPCEEDNSHFVQPQGEITQGEQIFGMHYASLKGIWMFGMPTQCKGCKINNFVVQNDLF